METYLEKGFDKLTQDELQDLRMLSKAMREYERKNFAPPTVKSTAGNTTPSDTEGTSH